MSLNESIVEDAALEWSCLRAGTHRQIGELGYAVGHGPHIAPGEPAAERDSFGDVVQPRCTRTLTRPLPRGEEKREAIRRLNPAIPSRTLATLRDTLLPKLRSGELSVAKAGVTL